MSEGGGHGSERVYMVLLQNSTRQIEFLKNQQWTITRYCLLMYAAGYGIMRLLQPEFPAAAIGLLLVPLVAVCVAGCTLLTRFRESITEHRGYVNNVYKQYKDICSNAGVSTSESTNRDMGIFVTLLATLVVGLLVVGWLYAGVCLTK